MALVKIHHAGVNFDYRDPEVMRQAVENAKRVFAQTQRKLTQQDALISKLDAGLADLEAQVAAEKARKAEQRKVKRACA